MSGYFNFWQNSKQSEWSNLWVSVKNANFWIFAIQAKVNGSSIASNWIFCQIEYVVWNDVKKSHHCLASNCFLVWNHIRGVGLGKPMGLLKFDSIHSSSSLQIFPLTYMRKQLEKSSMGLPINTSFQHPYIEWVHYLVSSRP